MSRRSVVLAVMAATIASRAEAQSINFDGTGAPCAFASTSPLTSLYTASLGVSFGGSGAILNQCGNFGVNALSGTDFWAFNIGTYATGPATITFANPVSVFSIFASGGHFNNVFTVAAFNGSTALGAITTATAAHTWNQLGFSAASITSVTIHSQANFYVYDDLAWTQAPTTVPEPATMVLLATGLAGVAAARRRRKESA